MAHSVQEKDYFKFVLTWLKLFAVPIEPLNMSWFGKVVYTIYSITFLVLFPLGFLISQICELPNSVNDLKRLMFGMGYIFSDSLGKIIPGDCNTLYIKKLSGIVKMTMFFRKRKQIYDMCIAFESGRMLPHKKRGGEKEYIYVKAANREMIIQVRSKIPGWFRFVC